MKSAAIGFFTIFSALVLLFTVGLIWSSSAAVDYQRVVMTGDGPIYWGGEPDPAPGIPPTDIEPLEAEMENTVIWISITGFRGDYIGKANADFMESLSSDGAYTVKLRPNFPALTYPGHVAMATGTTVDHHGIPGDRFRVGDSIVENPMDPSLLKAEPIWETATRQGIPTLVHDWPLSQNQTGKFSSAYFLNDFDLELSDEQRLDRLWDTWVTHRGEQKLRLLMCRLDDIKKAGQLNGPLSEDTYEAVRKTDALVETFVEKSKAAWSNLRGTNTGNLVFLITSDHGMAELDKCVNIRKLLGPEVMTNIDVASHDAIAHLYFKDLPEGKAEADLRKDQIDAVLKKKTYFRSYRPEDLPGDWHYRSEDGRIGDRVLVLRTGFSFSDVDAEEGIFDPSEGNGFYGGFGYPVSDSIRMSGTVILYGYPNQVAYGDLDEIDQTVFHKTVCGLLKIEASEKASDLSLDLRR